MPTINDGGPAFPFVSHGGVHEHQWCSGGMTLRDWFAGQALQGMASIALDDGDMIMGWSDMSKAAYKAADAMIEARKGGET